MRIKTLRPQDILQKEVMNSYVLHYTEIDKSMYFFEAKRLVSRTSLKTLFQYKFAHVDPTNKFLTITDLMP